MTGPAAGAAWPPRPTIGLLSPCGWGNLGDAAIQDVAIAAVRARWPDGRIVAFTSNPADTRERHGVPAFPLSGHAPPNYSIGGRSLPRTAQPVDAVLARLERVAPLRGSARALRSASDFVHAEPGHLRLARRWLREMALLVVSGGGQIDDYWGGAWGHPYVLWKWSALARSARVPVAVVSVGLGTLRTSLAQRFARGALVRARYRSYRDERTRDGVARLLGADLGGPVVPDLAFGYRPPPPTSGAIAGADPTAVGVGPIAYCDPRVWPRKDPRAYRAYVERLGRVVARLTAEGRPVRFFCTDWGDRPVVEDVWAAAGAPALASRTPTPTLPDLFAAFAGVGTVIASRLHGVLLAHLAGRPVAALSYDWKVARHMEEMQQSAFCLDIEGWDDAALGTALAGLERAWAGGEMRESVARSLAAYRARVDAQFAEVFR